MITSRVKPASIVRAHVNSSQRVHIFWFLLLRFGVPTTRRTSVTNFSSVNRDILKMPKNLLSSPFEEDLRKERRRTRRRRGRKEKERKSGRRETHHPATFPLIVDRTKTSPFLRQRSRKYHSPDLPSSSHSGYESAEFSDSQEFYLESMACLREAAACSTRSKLPIPKTIAELPQPKKRSRKKKEDHAHPLYPAYLERPPSRNGLNFARDSPYRSMDHIPARKSLETMPGFSDRPEKRCIKKPKLPPISDKENRSHKDDCRTHAHIAEYPFGKRF